MKKPNIKISIKETIGDEINEVRTSFMNSISAMEEEIIGYVERWEKYTEELKDYYDKEKDLTNLIEEKDEEVFEIFKDMVESYDSDPKVGSVTRKYYKNGTDNCLYTITVKVEKGRLGE